MTITRPTTYDEAAGIILDNLHAYGSSHLLRVTDVKQVRSALRREAKRRGVSHRTHQLPDSDQMLVYTDHPSPEAQAHGERSLRAALESGPNYGCDIPRAAPDPDAPPPPWFVDMSGARLLRVVH